MRQIIQQLFTEAVHVKAVTTMPNKIKARCPRFFGIKVAGNPVMNFGTVLAGWSPVRSLRSSDALVTGAVQMSQSQKKSAYLHPYDEHLDNNPSMCLPVPRCVRRIINNDSTCLSCWPLPRRARINSKRFRNPASEILTTNLAITYELTNSEDSISGMPVHQDFPSGRISEVRVRQFGSFCNALRQPLRNAAKTHFSCFQW
jgi:hypothetical protein